MNKTFHLSWNKEAVYSNPLGPVPSNWRCFQVARLKYDEHTTYATALSLVVLYGIKHTDILKSEEKPRLQGVSCQPTRHTATRECDHALSTSLLYPRSACINLRQSGLGGV